jgi:hypothetical protein
MFNEELPHEKIQQLLLSTSVDEISVKRSVFHSKHVHNVRIISFNL